MSTNSGDSSKIINIRISNNSIDGAVNGVRINAKIDRLYYDINNDFQNISNLDRSDSGADITEEVTPLEESTQSISGPGAVDLDSAITLLTTTGADAYTLANGRYEGQEKLIIHKVNGGAATLTPVTLSAGTTITFNGVGVLTNLKWTNSRWYVMTNTAVVA